MCDDGSVPRALVLACSAVLIVGCTSSGTTDVSVVERVTIEASPTTSTVSPPVSTSEEPADGAFTVDSLGLSFALPESFEAVDDATYLFFAQSMTPPSLITILGAGDDIAGHDARPGETLSDLDLGVDEAVVITDAALDGLPAGLSGNELLVANGTQSFSVIMSGPASVMPDLWAVFVESLVVAPNA